MLRAHANKLLQSVEKHASWKKVIILFLGGILLATCFISMFFGLLKMDPKATMDSNGYYDSVKFYQLLEQQGPDGRQSYLILHLIDYLFIIVYTLLLISILYLLLRKVTKSNQLKYLSFIPWLIALSDLVENLSVDISILIYPRKITFLASISGYFTVAKMMILYVSLALILILLVMAAVQSIKTRVGKSRTYK
ncbi:MAG TPA: hypothetical protein VHY08_24975 [Bacillota bacterium]|nr:hypothetical protein [Bacillota bacterium]